MVTDKACIMAGNEQNQIVCDNQGIYLSAGGSVSLNTTSENFRLGGFFVQMNDFVRMIPSTTCTPIPPQVPMPPMALPISIVKELPIFIAMMV